MWYLGTTAQTRVKNHKKANGDASAKWKEVKGKPNKIIELILKEGPEIRTWLL